ncbi:MAG: triose-phosphate isomerase, partial [Anaerolineales bacterium]|nr:triose-phosphate isomerase [Anaerolineales bacterium]
MRKPFIAGNWKMNKTYDEAFAFVVSVRDELDALAQDGIDVAFCVPFIAISAVAEATKGTQLGVGAQNMYWEESGAYTGEIAP